MKKILNLLFAVAIMAVSVFGLGTTNALTINKDLYYEYYMTGGDGKLTMSVITENNDIVNNAIVEFFPESSGAQKVNVIPFKFTVEDGKTWDKDSDSATMYINIPKAFNMDKTDHIYLLRVNPSTGNKTAFDIGSKYSGNYQIKSYESIKDVITSSSVVSKGSNLKDDYFSGQYAVLTTSDFESKGDTYYLLITCQGVEVTTTTTTQSTTIPTTQPTTVPTTTQPTDEPTTTVENPQTGEVSNQLFILIGVIGLVGIASLGVKFAKANK